MYGQYEIIAQGDEDGHPDNWSFPANYQRFSAINRPRSLLGRRRTTDPGLASGQKTHATKEGKEGIHNNWVKHTTPRETPATNTWHTTPSLTHPVSSHTPARTPVSSKEGSAVSQVRGAVHSYAPTSRLCRRNLDYSSQANKIEEERFVLKEISNKTDNPSIGKVQQELPLDKENSDTESSFVKNLSNKDLNSSFIADETEPVPLNNSTCKNMSLAFLGNANESLKESSFFDPANNSSFMTAHGINTSDLGSNHCQRTLFDGIGSKTPSAALSLFRPSDSPIDPLAGILVHDESDSLDSSHSSKVNHPNETMYTTANESVNLANKRIVEFHPLQKPTLVTNFDIPSLKPSDVFLKPLPPSLPAMPKKDITFKISSNMPAQPSVIEKEIREQSTCKSSEVNLKGFKTPCQSSLNSLHTLSDRKPFNEKKHGLESDSLGAGVKQVPKRAFVENEQSNVDCGSADTTKDSSMQEISNSSGNSILDQVIMNNSSDVSMTNSTKNLSGDTAESAKQPKNTIPSNKPPSTIQTSLENSLPSTKPEENRNHIEIESSSLPVPSQKEPSVNEHKLATPTPTIQNPPPQNSPVFKQPLQPVSMSNSRERHDNQPSYFNQRPDFNNHQFHMPHPIVKNQPQHFIYVNNKPYNALSLLGRGGSSEVYQVIDPSSSKLMAIKCVNLASVEDSIANGYLNEIRLLEKLQGCPSVIKMFDHEFVKNNKMVYVVMEKGDIDLSKLIRDITKTKEISMSMIVYYWTEMLNAVKDIHDKGIIHSDLKPANFLLVSGRLKLIDFGIASSLQGDMTSVLKDVTTGTFNYMSPEAITCSNDSARTYKINYRSDVWSLGCILYNLLYGRTPYSHITNTWVKLQAIADRSPNVEFPKEPNGTPTAIRLALRWCLLKDPKARPTTAQLLQLPYHSPPPDTPLGSQVDNLMHEYIMKMFPECPIDLKNH